MHRIEVALANAPYDVCIAPGLLGDAAKYLTPLTRNGRFLAVTDVHVAEYVLPGLAEALATAGIVIDHYTLPPGEGAKSWTELEKLADWLLENHVERGDYILALGGGVVGDITGFAAHIIKRGCHFVQIPTTLLAQVDSSVGGKTAINSKAGKNLVGAFHQPSLVLIDPDVLDTLPRRELGAGFAEVVKYGLIDDADFFTWCEANVDAFFSGDRAVRSEAIAHAVQSKARIVAEDERETLGVRALLNLGHTFGHALEAETGYSDRLLHGEAVAAGMALAFRYSVRRGECAANDAARVSALLSKAALPTTLAEAGVSASGDALVAHMLHDKKREGGTLPFLLARGIGETYLAKDVLLSDVAEFLNSEL
jgi:3-dehydroquinate synthase